LSRPRTWPSDWEERRRGIGCAICAEGRPDETRYGARIFVGRRSDAYLQRDDVQRGYTVVVWRGRHVAEPTELNAEEAAQYWLEVLRVAKALEEHYEPAKTNYQILGNALPHLHAHLLLRYLYDPAPGRPLPWPESRRPPITPSIFAADLAALRARLNG
jgi:diadenosine tetraphosphate (Ap4A) HIT family hydrolase